MPTNAPTGRLFLTQRNVSAAHGRPRNASTRPALGGHGQIFPRHRGLRCHRADRSRGAVCNRAEGDHPSSGALPNPPAASVRGRSAKGKFLGGAFRSSRHKTGNDLSPSALEACRLVSWSSLWRFSVKAGCDRRQGAFPGFVEPALATSIEKVPSGERWIHEIKFDGYRVQVHLVNEAVKVFTRRGHDWTKRFRRSPTTPGTSALARPSSTARSWCRPETARPISRSCRTS